MHQKIDTAIILAGGNKDTSSPKCLEIINGKTALKHIIDSLVSANIKNIIISTHYHFDPIDEFVSQFKDGLDLNLYTIREQQLLGSGGAIKNILLSTNTSSALIIESQMYDTFNFSEALMAYHNQLSENIIIQSSNQPELFTGRYIVNSEIFNYTHLTKFSIENDLLPLLREDDISTIELQGEVKNI